MGYVLAGGMGSRYTRGYVGLSGKDDATVTYDKLFNKIWEKTIGKLISLIPGGVGDLISNAGKGLARTELKKYISSEANIPASEAKNLGTDTISEALTDTVINAVTKDEGLMISMLQQFGVSPESIGTVEEVMSFIMGMLKDPLQDAILKGINAAVEEIFGLEAEVLTDEPMYGNGIVVGRAFTDEADIGVFAKQSNKPTVHLNTGGGVPTLAIAGLGIAALVYFLA